MAKAATKQAGTGADAALVCPECGKTFTRAAALGAHRKMTDGVAGSSKAAITSRVAMGSAALRQPVVFRWDRLALLMRSWPARVRSPDTQRDRRPR